MADSHREYFKVGVVFIFTHFSGCNDLYLTRLREVPQNKFITNQTVADWNFERLAAVKSFAVDVQAYNFARRLKTLKGLTPYEYICKVSTAEPKRFVLDPLHQMPGLNT